MTQSILNFLDPSVLDQAATLIGHLSFIAGFISWAQSTLIRVRMIALVSLSLGLVYNGWTHMHMPEGQGIGLVLFWLAASLLQNAWKLSVEVRDTLEAPLNPASKELLVKSFPTMHSADWKAFIAAAETNRYRKGMIILPKGAACHSLSLVTSGKVSEERNGVTRICETGALWGELTYIVGEENFNASPVCISAQTETVTVCTWPYDVVRKFAVSSRFNAALQHGFVLSAGIKHGLLWTEAEHSAAVNTGTPHTEPVLA